MLGCRRDTGRGRHGLRGHILLADVADTVNAMGRAVTYGSRQAGTSMVRTGGSQAGRGDVSRQWESVRR